MKMYNYIVSIGCNTDNGEETIEQAKWMMRVYFPTVLFTRTLRNPAIAMGENTHDFYNALVCVRAHMTESKVSSICKAMQLLLGNTDEKRSKGIIAFDADVVIANGKIIRQKDYEREYFQTLLPELMKDPFTFLTKI